MSQMFDEMIKAARGRLGNRDPAAIARCAGVAYAEGLFRFSTLGIPVTVSWPEWEVTPKLDSWHELVLLHYLDLADGTPLTGSRITFSQQREGMVRGGGFDRKAESFLSQLDYDTLKTCCKELGGTEKQSNADYTVELPFLLGYPVTLNYWMADAEFPASGRLLLDSSAEHYLSVEDSVTVGELILGALAGGSKWNCG